MAAAEFLVHALAGVGVDVAGGISAGGLSLASADIDDASGGDGREVEVAVRHGLAHEGVEDPGAANVALVESGVPAAFGRGDARRLIGVVLAHGGDGGDGVAVGAVRADELDGAERPGRRSRVLADVRLRARIVAGTSSPVSEGAEADVREAGESRRFAEERLLASGFPVGECADRGTALEDRIARPEGSSSVVVRPDPLAFSVNIISTNPTEGEELGADDVGFGGAGDSGEATRGTEEAAGLADGACAPPVDGAVGATEEEHLLSLGGEDVARTDVPVDDTSGGGDGGGEEDDVTEDGGNLLGSEGTRGGDDAEFTLVVVESVVGRGGGVASEAEEIDLLGVARFDGDQDGSGRERCRSAREGDSLEGVDHGAREPSLSSDGFDEGEVGASASGGILGSGEAGLRRSGLGDRDAGFAELPDAEARGVGASSLGSARRAVNTGGTREWPALVLLPDAGSRNDAVFGVGEGSAIADRKAASLFFDELFSARSAVADGLGEDGTFASGDTFADRRAR